jgi:hypothetical protein
MNRYAMLALLALLPASAMANEAAATKCRGKLNPEATQIYDKSLPLATPDANLRDVVTQQTRALVASNSIQMPTARANAEAAGKCLKMRNQ